MGERERKREGFDSPLHPAVAERKILLLRSSWWWWACNRQHAHGTHPPSHAQAEWLSPPRPMASRLRPAPLSPLESPPPRSSFHLTGGGEAKRRRRGEGVRTAGQGGGARRRRLDRGSSIILRRFLFSFLLPGVLVQCVAAPRQKSALSSRPDCPQTSHPTGSQETLLPPTGCECAAAAVRRLSLPLLTSHTNFQSTFLFCARSSPRRHC